jgi:anaerobic magnesium-protoporphyrin IX monomethyl ester cyclase
MVDILFGQSYFLRFDPKLWEAMQPYPPLGTLYAASYLRAKGYSVALFDAMLAESEQEWAAALVGAKPQFAVLYEDNFNYLSKMCLLRMRQAAFTMIEMARRAGCTVIVCGADATDHAGLYLSQGADFVLLGEGELTLGELIDRLVGRNEQPFESILGLAYVTADRGRLAAEVDPRSAGRGLPSFFSTPRRADIKDLDALPFPAWDLVDVERYRRVWKQRHGYYSMNMVTTRGCPFHCNWCAKPIWGQRYNVRSPENVVAELAWLKRAYAPDYIWFVDDIMGLKPGWLPRFAELVERQEARTPFKCLSRVDLLLRPGEIEALHRAGGQIVWVGAESGSQKILDAMEKGTRVEQIREAARRLHAAGLQVGFFLQFGYPGETLADIELTLQIVRACRPDDIGMSVSYPLPGTPFHERVKSQLGAQQNWHASDDLAMLYQGPFTTDFYRQLHRVLHKEFRSQRIRQQLANRSIHRAQSSPLPTFQTSLPSTFNLQLSHRFRTLAALAYYSLTLPVERARLGWLARRPHRGISPLPTALNPRAAARPTPQED